MWYKYETERLWITEFDHTENGALTIPRRLVITACKGNQLVPNRTLTIFISNITPLKSAVPQIVLLLHNYLTNATTRHTRGS